MKHTILIGNCGGENLEALLSSEPVNTLNFGDSFFATLEAVVGLAIGMG